MTTVLLHYPSLDDPPDAVFWQEDDGTLRSVVAEETDQLLYGRHVLAQLRGPWDAIIEEMSSRSPDGSGGVWEDGDATGMIPSELLKVLRRR